VSFAAVTLYVASQRVFAVVYFVINSVRKLSVTPTYTVEWDAKIMNGEEARIWKETVIAYFMVDTPVFGFRNCGSA
jgi:hypothetical protein